MIRTKGAAQFRDTSSYGMFAIIPQINDNVFILKEICESLKLSEDVRKNDLHYWEL